MEKIKSHRILLINSLFLILALMMYKQEFNLFLMLTVVFLSTVYRFGKEYWVEIAIPTIGFPIVEIICIVFGLWKYSVTSILVIPLWLFPAWGQASFTIIYLHKRFQYKYRRKIDVHIIDFHKETEIDGKKFNGAIVLEESDNPIIGNLLKGKNSE